MRHESLDVNGSLQEQSPVLEFQHSRLEQSITKTNQVGEWTLKLSLRQKVCHSRLEPNRQKFLAHHVAQMAIQDALKGATVVQLRHKNFQCQFSHVFSYNCNPVHVQRHSYQQLRLFCYYNQCVEGSVFCQKPASVPVSIHQLQFLLKSDCIHQDVLNVANVGSRKTYKLETPANSCSPYITTNLHKYSSETV